ncbi:nuclear migration protein nudC-like [Drosophila kikkawai]|uniref:Nuclear migration protein nudC-like n=1 Tax=Drosophila kikkawai TaxID=30033 RepID=A0A6P4ISU5_DROKI|nr:uncharacterized protein LOC108076985 [Drosophila kikkawai]
MKYTFGILILGLVFLGTFAARVNHTSQYFTMETNTEPVEIRLQEDFNEDILFIVKDLNNRLKQLEANHENKNMKIVKEKLERKSTVQDIDEQLKTWDSLDNDFSAEEASMEKKDRDQYKRLENN